ncbi:hypothetical protein PGT21_027529 [Puccinia graminis f. sp. tritici]|uniref:Transcription regulator Rua1 C-terminal domain-containing protein n=1 Tax=Puccinia graminis f. sp. tritici TaxID=56615 RepID=A0A5B0QJJ9_PUCGR|nr:hypothetical protein PGT21_027529 [Puccinia graminis f. sp. tritici]
MFVDGMQQTHQPSSCQSEDQEQHEWLGHGSSAAEPCNALDGSLTPTRSCLAKPPDGQPSFDHQAALLYPASDYSNFLSNYLVSHPSIPAGLPHDSSTRPYPVSNHPSYLIHSPQQLPVRPAAAGRRATVSSVPSRLPYNCSSAFLQSQYASEPPPTLDAAYNLLAGWGDAPTCFQALSHSAQEQLLESSYKEADLVIGIGPEQYILSGGSHSSCANQAFGGPSRPDGLESDLPFATPHHRHSLQQWDYPSKNSDLSLLQSTVQAGLDFQPSPALLAASSHHLAHSLLNSNQTSPASAHFIPPPAAQPTQLSPEWNPGSAYLPYDPSHTYTQPIFNHNWEQSMEPNSGLSFMDNGMPFVGSNSPVLAPCHPEPRRVSDPSPVAPIAQRPWDPRQRYSIANIPCHLSLEGDSQYFDSLKPLHDLPASCAGSSRHSDSFSTTASQLNSGELNTPSTGSFGNEVSDQWAQLALQHFEEQAASFGNLDFSHNVSLAPIDHSSAHQKSPSCRSKSSGSPSAQEGSTGLGGPSGSDLDTDSIQAVTKPVEKRGRAATLSESHTDSSLPLDSFTASNRAQFTSEYMDIFRQQSGQLPFGLAPLPHRSISPYAPSAVFPTQVDFSHLSQQGISPFTESFQQCSSVETPLLPQHGSREAQIQQQNRLRRLTVMTQPMWPESHTDGAGALQSSPSASFRGYHDRVECQLSSSPEKQPLAESGNRGGLVRKRKSMKNQYPLTQIAVPEEPEQESSGNGSDDLSTGLLFQEVTFAQHEEGMSQESQDSAEGCGQPTGGSSPAYTLTRFGGIGQGRSAHPPGLNGSVRPSSLDLAGVVDETGEMMVPWKQDLRCDEDLYTPMWCRGQNDKKEGFCDMCRGGAWFRLKNSAYWYHKQYFHGVSSTTGHYFYPPQEIKRGFSTANRQQILGKCHECEEWVGFSSIIGNGIVHKKNHHHHHQQQQQQQLGTELVDEDPGSASHWIIDHDDPASASNKVPTLWYKHAHKCHRHQTCKGAKGRLFRVGEGCEGIWLFLALLDLDFWSRISLNKGKNK